MALNLADRVQDTSSTTGTGALTLNGTPPVGYRSFGSALSVGDTCYYCATDGTNWEVGLGTLTASTSLARTQVLSSSASGGLVSFAALVTVFITLPGEAVLRRYAASFGDGTSTTFVINHGLGTRDVTVCVYTNAAPYDEWDADVQHTDANDVTITFATAPAASGMRVVVHG